jgi:hypothetical protein
MFCFLQLTAKMQANPCKFLTVHKLKLLSIKNLPIYPCKKYLLCTNGISGGGPNYSYAKCTNGNLPAVQSLNFSTFRRKAA